MSAPQLILLAGPNGAGKTTSSAGLIPADIPYINADLIAQELTGQTNSPGDIHAGRVLLARVTMLEHLRETFAVETTLSARTLATRLGPLQDAGYDIQLVFFWLPSEEMAIERVRLRVELGGHAVPEGVIRRRYRRGLHNFVHVFRPLVDQWRVYDASTLSPELIARGATGQPDLVFDPLRWHDVQYGWQ